MEEEAPWLILHEKWKIKDINVIKNIQLITAKINVF